MDTPLLQKPDRNASNRFLSSSFVPLLCLLLLLSIGLSACAPNTGIFGGNWQVTGLQHTHIRSLEVDPNNQQVLYAGDQQNGVYTTYTTPDGGTHWTQSRVGLPLPVFVHALSFDTSGKNLYAATDHGIYASTDSAHHWSAAGKTGSATGDLPVDTYTSLAFNVKAPRTIYAGTLQHGVLVSTDSGTTWATAGTGLPASDAINGLTFDANTGQLWVATAQGIYRSDDRGASWRAFNTGLPASLSVNDIQPADVAGGLGSLIYAATNQGFFLSQDGGAYWAASEESLKAISIYTVQVDFRSTNATTVYIGTSVGAFRSDDSGENWGGIAAGLPRAEAVYALIIGGLNNSQLYAATNADGIYIFPGTSNGINIGHLWPLLLIAALFIALYALISRTRRRTLLQVNRQFEPEEPEEAEEDEGESGPPPVRHAPTNPSSTEEPPERT
jgi:ligand-binding sensor domain-containing protein